MGAAGRAAERLVAIALGRGAAGGRGAPGMGGRAAAPPPAPLPPPVMPGGGSESAGGGRLVDTLDSVTAARTSIWCPHLRHFIRTVLPATLSSEIWYFALH